MHANQLRKKKQIASEERAVPVQCPRVQSPTESPPLKPQPNSAESLNPQRNVGFEFCE